MSTMLTVVLANRDVGGMGITLYVISITLPVAPITPTRANMTRANMTRTFEIGIGVIHIFAFDPDGI